MGTQQVLLIVLAVIIVGVAVAVGITMFGKQSASANIDALKADLMSLGAQAIAFYKTPAGMAGGGNGSPGFGASFPEVCRTVGSWIGFGQDGKFENDNGFYTLYTYINRDFIYILAWGNEKGQNPTYTNWTCPPGRIGNIYIYMTIQPKLTPPLKIYHHN